jgi:hypothetical protein
MGRWARTPETPNPYSNASTVLDPTTCRRSACRAEKDALGAAPSDHAFMMHMIALPSPAHKAQFRQEKLRKPAYGATEKIFATVIQMDDRLAH